MIDRFAGRVVIAGVATLASLLAPLLTVSVVPVASAAGDAQVTSPANHLQVWNLNTKKMSVGFEATHDYKDFVAYIADPARSDYYPDLVTLQEVSVDDSKWCTTFAADLDAATGLPPGTYACEATRKQGGSAILYRTGRLKQLATKQFYLKRRNAAGDCVTVSNGAWAGIVSRFRDTKSDKWVSASSVHLATDGNHCAWDNMKLHEANFDAIGDSHMRIMAGDWNATDVGSDNVTWEYWYRCTNRDPALSCPSTKQAWKDVVYQTCATPVVWATCIRDGGHLTTTIRRIDFLFARAYAQSRTTTVQYDDADVSAGQAATDARNYSDHRGQGSLLTYYDNPVS